MGKGPEVRVISASSAWPLFHSLLYPFGSLMMWRLHPGRPDFPSGPVFPIASIVVRLPKGSDPLAASRHFCRLRLLGEAALPRKVRQPSTTFASE